MKIDSKSARFRREKLALMHEIRGKWTRAYTITDCLGIERLSRPENLLNYDPPPGVASSPQLSALWVDANQCALDVLELMQHFCEDWNLDQKDLWWTYLNWPSSAETDGLWNIAQVSGSEAEARLAVEDVVSNPTELMREFDAVWGRPPSTLELIALDRLKKTKPQKEKWVQTVLRRRDGAGRPTGSTSIREDEYPARKADAIKAFTDRTGRAPNAIELQLELGIDKATYYRYERRERRSLRKSAVVIYSADSRATCPARLGSVKE